MQKFIVIILLSVFSLNLSAQNSDSSKTSVGKATVVHIAEINAAAKKIDGLVVADSVLRVVSIEGKYNIGVSIVSRSKINGKTPTDAIVHNLVTEVYHIIEGRGTLVVGGRLDSAVQFPPDGPIVRKITGPTSLGKRIIGGTRYEVGPGDIVVIPLNTPHGFIELKTNKIVYTLIRVDPDRVLELKN